VIPAIGQQDDGRALPECLQSREERVAENIVRVAATTMKEDKQRPALAPTCWHHGNLVQLAVQQSAVDREPNHMRPLGGRIPIKGVTHRSPADRGNHERRDEENRER
jgi:hypothetical protein